MKKLLVIGIVAVMMMGLAVAANATGDAWFVYMHAGLNNSAADGAASSKFGVRTQTSDLFSGNQASYSAAVPEIWYHDATHALPADPINDTRYFQVQYAKKNVNTAAPLVFDFRLVGQANQLVTLTAWNQTGTTSDWDGVTFSNLVLYKVDGAVKTAVYSFNKAENGSNDGSAMSGTYFQQAFNLGSAGYQEFELVANSTPEPGSLVAMLSGLVGLVGFGIRRRK